jgi:hypothetical protein
LLIVVALITTIGGHWVILQSVAWVSMAITYSQEAPLAEALVKTFDGKHPCQLCEVVKSGKQAEKKQPSLKVETKFEFLPLRTAFFVSAPVVLSAPVADPGAGHGRSESPPTPPPRLA